MVQQPIQQIVSCKSKLRLAYDCHALHEKLMWDFETFLKSDVSRDIIY